MRRVIADEERAATVTPTVEYRAGAASATEAETPPSPS